MIEMGSLTNALQFRSPRRVMKYVLLYCSSGSIEMLVDENTYRLNENQLITITSGQIHAILHENNAAGYWLEFTLDFFCKDDTDLELIFHNGLFCHFAMNEVIALADGSYVMRQLQDIEEELKWRSYQYLMAAHSKLKLILIAINRNKVEEGGELYKPDALFLKFLEMVRASFEKNLPAKEIALALKTTESKLNELAKLHTGKTAQHVIYGLIASEAKRLFLYEKLSVKEVAYALGFKDPFYFSNFFKKQIGHSPKKYKEKMSY